MRSDIEYKMWVEGPLYMVMTKIIEDAKVHGIEYEELVRAVWVWVTEQMGKLPDAPWMQAEMARIQREAAAALTVEGEAG